MRKKEHKPTPEDIKRMNDIMDSIVGEDNDQTVREFKPYPKDEAPF